MIKVILRKGRGYIDVVTLYNDNITVDDSFLIMNHFGQMIRARLLVEDNLNYIMHRKEK